MRYPSIDILRTFAIFIMVLVHFGENLSGFHSPLTGFGAPLFAFLSGVSYRLWANGQAARGKSPEEVSKVSVRRGLFVFGVGFAFNVLVWLPEDTFNWDVLTFVGTALLLLNFARRVPLPACVLLAVFAALASPLLQSMADYAAYWENGYFECDLTLSDVLIGFLVTGYFPIFPWIAFSLAGFAVSAALFGEGVEGATGRVAMDGAAEQKATVWPTVLVGTALIVAALGTLGLRTRLPAVAAEKLLRGWTMFPPTLEYVACTLGIALILLGVGHRYVDCNPRALLLSGPLDVAKTFSRHSFTIYVLHHFVHLWPLWLYGVATGNEPTEFWMKAMPIAGSIPLALVFLAACYGILRWLGPERTYGIESWMRWLCD